MCASSAKTKRVLAIDPTSRGLGFTVLEGPDRLIDWGVKQARVRKNSASLKLVAGLIERYRPDSLLVEDVAARSSRRCQRVRELIASIGQVATEMRVAIHRLSRHGVRLAFAESCSFPATKHAIATAIAGRFPELTPRLPSPRKAWMSEDERMAIFDGVAFALAWYRFVDQRNQKAEAKQAFTSSHDE